MKNIPYTGIVYILAISIILVIPAALFGLCSLFDFRLINGENDPMRLGLSFTNAPEGTVRIEPLVKSEDGYTSISEYCEEIEDDWLKLSNETPEEIQKRRGRFKAAYIDENGNVLGITDAARMKYGCSKPRGLSADGDTLTFATGNAADWQIKLLLVVFLLEPLTIVGLAVMIILSAVNAVSEKIAERKHT
ncbi:MAG: hypothetical protein HDT43_05265 [Ruminococcaceae bacterium]|nr:hypothetical protein [Oscillospiraceae bacterium]